MFKSISGQHAVNVFNSQNSLSLSQQNIASRICEDVPSRKRSGEDISVKGGKLTRKILVKECDMFSILRRVFTHGKRIRISQEAGCTWLDFLQGIDYRRRVQQSKNSYYERI